MRDHDRTAQDETPTTAGQGARRPSETDREHAAAEPLGHPCPERRAGVRARHRIGEVAAVADAPPGILGGPGPAGGHQPGAAGPARPARPPAPGRHRTPTGTPSAEPGSDDEGPANRPER